MTPIPITSLADPRVANYRNLKDRDLDRAGRFFIAEGEHLVRRLLESDFPIDSVFLTDRRLAEIAPLVPAGIPVYVAPAQLMNDVLGMKFHSGVIACGRRKSQLSLEKVVPKDRRRLTLVICPDITNVENIGSIVRISAAFGADALILGEQCHDPFWRQSVRVSMGTIFRLPLLQSDNLLRDMARLKDEWGVQLAATVLDESAESLARADRPPRFGILFGSEPQGLGPVYQAACDRKVTIPMKMGTDSLNVAVAAGIFLYHFTQAEHR
jgi:tRNA G18 (ribose-2'-O)-methylase SpoU